MLEEATHRRARAVQQVEAVVELDGLLADRVGVGDPGDPGQPMRRGDRGHLLVVAVDGDKLVLAVGIELALVQPAHFGLHCELRRDDVGGDGAGGGQCCAPLGWRFSSVSSKNVV
jgi:hypothetical protein